MYNYVHRYSIISYTRAGTTGTAAMAMAIPLLTRTLKN